jgi:hypothetical protein
MMKEILGVTNEPRTRRRWFHDESFDLFVWETDEGELVSFQLCYGAAGNEQALVWNKEAGFFRDGAERGPAESGSEGSPDPMLARIDRAAGELPADIRTSLVTLVREYARKPAVTSRRKRFRRADWQKVESQTR